MLIAEISTYKVGIKPQHSKTPILRDYLNKDYENFVKGVKSPEFKRFIFKYIKKEEILNLIMIHIQKEN